MAYFRYKIEVTTALYMNPNKKIFFSSYVISTATTLFRAAIALLWIGTAGAADVSSQAQWTIASGGNGHTYRVVAKPNLISWDGANSEAGLAGGYLATITSPAENAFVFSLIDNAAFWTQSANDHGPWIGGFQPPGSSEPGGGFTWVTQPGASSVEPFSYANWEAGEPNNLTASVLGTTYNQDRISFFHSGSGRAASWSDEYNLTGSPLNQWTISYVIEFNSIPEPTATGLFCLFGFLTFGRRLTRAKNNR
jgi:hypothetical protein